jgi:GGDEF domain-containing protein
MTSRSRNGQPTPSADDLRLGLQDCSFVPRFEAAGRGRRSVRVVVSLNLRRQKHLNIAFGLQYGDTVIEELGRRLTDELIAAREELRGTVDLAAGRSGEGYVVLIDADRPRDADDIAGRCSRTDFEPCGDPPTMVQWLTVSVVSDPSANSLSLARRAMKEYQRDHVQIYHPAWLTWHDPAVPPQES